MSNQLPAPIGIETTTTNTIAIALFMKPNHHITNNKHIIKSHPADNNITDNDDNSTNVYYVKDDSAMMMGPLLSSLPAADLDNLHTTIVPLTISLPRGHIDEEDVSSLGTDDDNIDTTTTTTDGTTTTTDGGSSSKEFSGTPSPSTTNCPVIKEESDSSKSVKSILMSEDISVRRGRLKRNVSWSDLAGVGELVEVKMYVPEKKSLLPAEAIFQDCVCSIM